MRRGFYALVLLTLVVATFALGPAILGLSAGPSPEVTPAGTGDPPAIAAASPLLASMPIPDPTPMDFASSDGYSVTLPAGWSASSIGRAEQSVLLNLVGGPNPDLADLVRDVLGRTGAEVSMVGGDIRSLADGGVPPNVSVLIAPAGSSTLDSVAGQTEAVIARLKGVTGPVDMNRMPLPAIDSIRFDFLVERSAGATPIRVQTYVVTHGSRTYLISCATSPDRFPAVQASFDAFVRSFHLDG